MSYIVLKVECIMNYDVSQLFEYKYENRVHFL